MGEWKGMGKEEGERSILTWLFTDIFDIGKTIDLSTLGVSPIKVAVIRTNVSRQKVLRMVTHIKVLGESRTFRLSSHEQQN